MADGNYGSWVVTEFKRIDQNEIEVSGVRFRSMYGDYSGRTNSQTIVMLKPWQWINVYGDIAIDRKLRNILELGIFEGGSAILMALLYPETKIVAIDSREPSPEVRLHIERLGLQDRVKLFYGTLQNDREALGRIISSEFPDGLDMVIDDASHQYVESKASFEILFPRLPWQGTYIIEDWAWSHQPGAYQDSKWLTKPALSNLIFELVMLAGGCGDLVKEIRINASFSIVTKNGNRQDGPFSLDGSYLTRGHRLNRV